MAGLKKKKKEKSSSPNIVLVIFVVFFFLVSIGLGIWGYYGYAGQDELRAKRHAAEATAKGEKQGRAYFEMLYRDMRAGVGDSLEASDLDKEDLQSFLSPDFGKFKDEKTKESAKKLMDDLKLLHKDYSTDLVKELRAAQAKSKEWEGKATAAVAQNKRMEDFVQEVRKKQDTFQKDAMAKIDKDSADQLNVVKQQGDAFQKLTELNQALNKDLDAKQAEILKSKDDTQDLLKQKDRIIARLEADLKDKAGAGGGAAAVVRGGDTFPLILDISPGKPLWDHPVGKVMRVDLDTRQVAINVGASHGAKPELTFNIFGANTYGRAEKQLKGSIEIIKVVDANTSIARITSLYDAEGREILLTAKSRFQLVRESEAPIREGDLLYNLFFGTRVAVAGYVGITGDLSDNPAEQARQMDDFLHLLQRNGIQVDAFVDLRDGKISGAITSKTRYLIRGYDLRTAGEDKPAAKMAGDEKEKDKDKEPAKDAAANTDRNAMVNKANEVLRSEAKDRGLLQISAENFAVVIGYRRARSANSPELSAFRPSLPYAGAPRSGGGPENRPEEKKAPEMEKKDGN